MEEEQWHGGRAGVGGVEEEKEYPGWKEITVGRASEERKSRRVWRQRRRNRNM
jgi:hypothetical protein